LLSFSDYPFFGCLAVLASKQTASGSNRYHQAVPLAFYADTEERLALLQACSKGALSRSPQNVNLRDRLAKY
jgi:hypothetical protein